jgi:hypothetical protein
MGLHFIQSRSMARVYRHSIVVLHNSGITDNLSLKMDLIDLAREREISQNVFSIATSAAKLPLPRRNMSTNFRTLFPNSMLRDRDYLGVDFPIF